MLLAQQMGSFLNICTEQAQAFKYCKPFFLEKKKADIFGPLLYRRWLLSGFWPSKKELKFRPSPSGKSEKLMSFILLPLELADPFCL